MVASYSFIYLDQLPSSPFVAVVVELLSCLVACAVHGFLLLWVLWVWNEGLPFESPVVDVERVARIELATKPWQGLGLPLHHTRVTKLFNHEIQHR